MDAVEQALVRVIRSEDAHLGQLWESSPATQRLALLALAEEPTASPYAAYYHSRHELPPAPTLQTALEGLIRRE